MTGSSKSGLHRNGWLARAAWFLGVGVFLLELNIGVNYVLGGVHQYLTDSLCLVATFGSVAARIVADACHNFGSLESAARVLPLSALPVALIGLAMVLERRSVQ